MGWSTLDIVRGLTATACGAVGFIAFLVYKFQGYLIYPSYIPDDARKVVDTPDKYGIPYEDLTLTSTDGTRIKAFLMLQGAEAKAGTEKAEGEKGAQERPTLLFLHANAGNMGHRLPLVKVFYQRMRMNVLIVSYRGYGLSEGSPNEKGMREDAQTALDYIKDHPIIGKTPLILYGQSIGGAVAIDLAARNAQRISGLVLENTFLSLPLLVPHIMPFAAPFVPYLLHQIWDSQSQVTKFPTDGFPVLFLSGLKDTLIPPAHMAALRDKCTSRTKVWKTFEDGTHNDTCIQPGYFAQIADFIRQEVLGEIAPQKEDEKMDLRDILEEGDEEDEVEEDPRRKATLDPERYKGVEKPLDILGAEAGSRAPVLPSGKL